MNVHSIGEIAKYYTAFRETLGTQVIILIIREFDSASTVYEYLSIKCACTLGFQQ